jgi:hypothetical protein
MVLTPSERRDDHDPFAIPFSLDGNCDMDFVTRVTMRQGASPVSSDILMSPLEN